MDALLGGPRPRLIGPPLKAGHISTLAQKNIVQIFCLVASIVVWGSIVDTTVVVELVCGGWCIFSILLAAVSTVAFLMIIFRFPRALFHQLRHEVSALLMLVGIWIILAAIVNRQQVPITKTGTVFSWLGLLGVLWAVFKVIHALKEEESFFTYNYTLESYISAEPDPKLAAANRTASQVRDGAGL